MAITVNNKKIRELLDENDRTALWASGRIEELEKKLETKIEEKEPEMPEPERPNKDEKGKKLLWYPQATVPSRKMPDRGLYKNGKGHDLPSGIVWHFSAGRLKPAINTHNWGTNQGFGFMTLDVDGELIQGQALNEWGYHAGNSRYALKFPSGSIREVTSVSSYLVGVEMCNPGNLTRVGDWCYPWFNKSRSASQPRWRADQCIYQSESRGNLRSGWYLPMSAVQMAEMFELALWMKDNDPEGFFFENNVGHDECAWPRGRKPDPGATLWIDDPKKPVTMEEIREHLKGLHN